MTRARAGLILALLFLAGCSDPARGGRSAVRIVGSSTVFPFTAAVAERFVRRYPDVPAPVVESTGTGAGMRLFCGGVGADYPDLEDASRRMSPAEYRHCAANGASRLIELEIGRDGVVFVQSRAGASLPLTSALLYRALGAAPGGRTNRARTWRELDPRLPATAIRVYGPPATSGTRDVLTATLLRRGCMAVDRGATGRCTQLREDGAYVDAGENDNVVIARLRTDPQAIGIVGYGYLRENAATVRGLMLDGVAPTYRSIADGRYPAARSLYLYAKVAHLAAVPRLRELLQVYVESWGPGGPLTARGLIAAPATVRARSAAALADGQPFGPASLRETGR